MSPKTRWMLPIKGSIFYYCCGNLDEHEITIGVMGDGGETPLSMIRSCQINVPPNGALNMNESPHLIIGYLLRGEYAELKSKFYD